MSLDDSGLYILNIIKNPKLTYPVFKAIENNELKTIDEIRTTTSLSKEQVNEAVTFLQSMHFIEKINEVYKKNEDIFDKVTSELSFKVNIVNQFAKLSRVDDIWEKQAAFYLKYKYFLTKKEEIIDVRDNVVIENINRWFEAIKYTPRNPRGGIIRVNREKMNNWVKLANYVGLLYELKPTLYVNMIDSYLFYKIMSKYGSISGEKECSISGFFEWLNTSFLPIDDQIMTSTDIPIPYSNVLKNLHLKKMIQLEVYGDYVEYKFENDRLDEGPPSSFNIYRLK